jgi:hypothetical protein
MNCDSKDHGSFDCVHALETLVEYESRYVKRESKEHRRSKDISTRRGSRHPSRSFSPDKSHSRLDVKQEAGSPCFLFNTNISCNVDNCKFDHHCVVCGSGVHGWSDCLGRMFCKDFATRNCFRSPCDRRHWCLMCHDQHSMNECQKYDERIRKGDNPLEYCIHWNTTGFCHHANSCTYKHDCLYCHAQDHGSVDCEHALEKLLNLRRDVKKEYKEKRNSLGGPSRHYHQSSDMIKYPSYETRKKTQEIGSPCFLFNKNQYCDVGICQFSHTCAICSSDVHGWSDCPNRKLCQNYGLGKCKRNPCDRRHSCMLCHAPHPMDVSSCELFRERVGTSDNPMKYCQSWNYLGSCDFAKRRENVDEKKLCRFVHECSFCYDGGHGSLDCEHALRTLLGI